MANQPEQPTYDAGVYQYETTDPVIGGVGGLSNAPLLNLANRTAWLYQQVNALNQNIGLVAPVASPVFTGTPLSVTPAAGDNSTKIATTAFVQETISGIAAVNVAGNSNVVLQQGQWGLGIILFSGALTGDISAIFPSQAGKWTVINDTTGAFMLTVKTAAGTGVMVPQGAAMAVYGDGTNIDAPVAGFSTGTVQMTINTVADPGWVMMNDGTIGSSASGATARAATDTLPLYTALWNNVSNTYAPVAGGRGASAAADFAANKPMGLPLVLGRALCGAGAGAGLTAYTLGETVGENEHLLVVGEMPAHAHGVNDPTHTHELVAAGGDAFGSAGVTGGASGSPPWSTDASATGITIQNEGGGAAHNNMQPSTFFNVMIKL